MASKETDSIIAYVKAQGIPYRVTDLTTPGIHSARSYHYAQGTDGQGLAVDFAGRTANNVPQMMAIYEALIRKAPKLKELIFNGPGTKSVRNGVVGNGLAQYGNTVWQAHRNHIHVSVAKGTFLADSLPPPVILEVRPMWDPPLQVVDFLPYWEGSGGYMLFADGGVGAVGDAPYREGQQPFGNDYWVGRKPARLERLGDDGYTVIATSGERYEYP